MFLLKSILFKKAKIKITKKINEIPSSNFWWQGFYI